MKKALLGASAAVILLVGGLLFMTPPPPQDTTATTTACPPGPSQPPIPATNPGPAVDRNAKIVIEQGRAAGVGVLGIQIALAVILVESNGLNLASRAVPESMRYPNDGVVAGDHLSINLFQQQVGMGWFDTVQHGMQVPVSSASFYAHLKAVPGWQTMGFGAAAQAVQRSAFPARYGEQQANAAALYQKLAGSVSAIVQPVVVALPVCSTPAMVPVSAQVVVSGSWANPLKPAHYVIGSPFGPRLDPITGLPSMHWGQDLLVPLGTPVHAECTGTVIFAGWDVWGGGNMTTLDCGGGLTIKNMHQSRLIAQVGAHVTAGTVTGLTGSTGHSNAPHLHEEVALNGTRIDPIPFMKAHGVPL